MVAETDRENYIWPKLGWGKTQVLLGLTVVYVQMEDAVCVFL